MKKSLRKNRKNQKLDPEIERKEEIAKLVDERNKWKKPQLKLNQLLAVDRTLKAKSIQNDEMKENESKGVRQSQREVFIERETIREKKDEKREIERD